MSEISDIYTCPTCTYEQSKFVTKCEMCDTPNLNQLGIDNSVTICPQCTFANEGDHVRVCEICAYSFLDGSSPKKFRADDDHDQDEDEDEEEDDNDDDDYYQIPMSQNTNEKRKPIEAVETAMTEGELRSYYQQYISILKQQRQQKQLFSDQQLREIICQLFHSLQYKHDEPEGQLVFKACQICFDKDEPLITMKACGHRMICPDDFHQYLITRIRDKDLLPWIPCPAEICGVPCDAKNITEDGRLTHGELLSFIIIYMSKKLSRNENFITCVHCEQGGFLQIGPPKKEEVECQVCHSKQTIEKGTDGDLDIAFKTMIEKGELRECPTCRHLTLKEKGLCNVIECVKCGIWWNWRTREQGHSGKDLKNKARSNGTLWEPGELHYQQQLERRNPAEFKALLERNGIEYNPNYVRGGWNDH
ncbi:hypothetical protein I4U23_023663 [Adineta vaga]|nr:hypothetical protein I4U23_023663 [Adineta vaga]